MLKKTLHNPAEGFEVDHLSGGKFALTWTNKNIRIFKIAAVLYILVSLFFSAALLAVYFKGEKVFDGQAFPLWFVSVFLASEWLPVCIVMWFLFARKTYFFDYKTFEIRTKRFWLLSQRFAIEKKRIHKILLVNQRKNASLYTLKIQSDKDEHTVFWLRPYIQCLWLGTVLADWSGKPFDAGDQEKAPNDIGLE